MSAPKHYEPCHCGSGKKYRKCHSLFDHHARELQIAHAAEEHRQREAEMTVADRAARKRRVAMMIAAAGLIGSR